ncbi:MAG TPA: hypothetical protein VIH89_09495 [Candidatus Sulfotelmatobacter sp.]|jgi:hypothetical protein
MSQRALKIIALGSSVLVAALGAVSVQAQSKTSYPSMAALDRYLMPDRNAEIALARSAAPDSISRDAKVLVLGPHGYETAVEGKNGFVCAVERGWMAPFDNREFWNPKIRGPLCFNPPAAHSILPITYKRTEMVLAGQSKAQVMEGIKIFVKKELPVLEPGALTYMMSKEAYLTDAGDHNMAHLMFYTQLMDGAALGADLRKSPVMLNPQFALERIDVFMVLTGMWSDGTLAPVNN